MRGKLPDWSQLRTVDTTHGFHSQRWTMRDAIAALFANCSKLEALDLRQCEITNTSLSSILKESPHVKYLKWTDKYAPQSSNVIVEYCHELAGFELMSDGMDGKVLGEIAKSNGNLQSLTLNECRAVDNLSLEQQALMHLLNLRSVELGPCADDETILIFAKYCPLLESITLKNDDSIVDSTILKVAQLCVHLKRLSLEGIWAISDSSLKSIGEHCPKLELLRVFGNKQVTDDGIATLTKGCGKLQTVELRSLPWITGLSILSIAENCAATMRELVVYNCSKLWLYSIVVSVLQSDCLQRMEKLDIAACRCYGMISRNDVDTFTALRQLLQRGTRLTHIGLDDSLFSDEEKSEMQNAHGNDKFK